MLLTFKPIKNRGTLFVHHAFTTIKYKFTTMFLHWPNSVTQHAFTTIKNGYTTCFYNDQERIHTMLLQRSRTDTQHAFTTIKNGYTTCFYKDLEQIHNMLLQRDHLISNQNPMTGQEIIWFQTPMTGQETIWFQTKHPWQDKRPPDFKQNTHDRPRDLLISKITKSGTFL